MGHLEIGTHVIFGKVDQVPGLFFVATRFFHVQFLPLVPLESFLVFYKVKKRRPTVTAGSLGGEEAPAAPRLKDTVSPARLVRLPGLFDYHQAVSIGLVGKSIRFAWLRLALFAGSAALLIWALVQGIEDMGRRPRRPGDAVALDLAPLLLGAFFLVLALLSTYRTTRAAPERALELARLAGIPTAAVRLCLAEQGFPEPEGLQEDLPDQVRQVESSN